MEKTKTNKKRTIKKTERQLETNTQKRTFIIHWEVLSFGDRPIYDKESSLNLAFHGQVLLLLPAFHQCLKTKNQKLERTFQDLVEKE